MKFKAKYLQNTTQQLIFKQFIEVSIEITSFCSNFQQKVILELHKILFITAQTCRTYLKKALLHTFLYMHANCPQERKWDY